jgi:hypothetical protein
MDINIDQLNAAIQELRHTLKEGLIATDIWEPAVGLSLAGYNSQPAAVALFTEMTQSLAQTLADSGFPQLRNYYLLELEGEHLVLILRHGNDLLQGVLLNIGKTNLGILFAVAIPKMLQAVQRMR